MSNTAADLLLPTCVSTSRLNPCECRRRQVKSVRQPLAAWPDELWLPRSSCRSNHCTRKLTASQEQQNNSLFMLLIAYLIAQVPLHLSQTKLTLFAASDGQEKTGFMAETWMMKMLFFCQNHVQSSPK